MVENGVPMFKKIKNGGETAQEIKTEKVFFIPGDATHAGIYAGKIAFFISTWPVSYKGRKWKFFKIPTIPKQIGERTDHVVLPEYKSGEGGHCYGYLEFF
ncbi:MAG: hypothetical protein AAB607_00815 [Patescibacteria group bacterium]